MKFLVKSALINAVKVTCVAGIVIALSNCASRPIEENIAQEQQAQRQAEAAQQKIREQRAKAQAEPVSRIQVRGSRITEADLAEQAAFEAQETAVTPQSPAPTSPEPSQANIESLFNDRQFNRERLSAAQKDELYQLVSRYPDAAGQIFKRYRVNPTIQSEYNAVSTFAMDVDNGSFKLASAMLQNNQMPDPAGIRVEEFVNALDYQYQYSDDLFALSAEAMRSPFREGFYLLHVGAQTAQLNEADRNPSNIVLVADVSGSMGSDDKIELLQVAMKTLVSQLGKNDQVALVAYSDSAKLLLRPTPASSKRKIYKAIERLKASGNTNVEEGLKMAYDVVDDMYEPGFNNRVILTSDGMANSGSRSPEAILAAITKAKQKGIFLTTLGVGKDVYNDYLLEQLANKGNGNYLYIADLDDVQEAFVDNINSQLQTVAKDAKVQVTFDPQFVTHYRLIGYENRHLEQQDFLDGSKDGAEIGAGQKVTAIYEIKFSDKMTHKLTSKNTQNIARLAVSYKKPEGNKVFQISKSIPSSIIAPGTYAQQVSDAQRDPRVTSGDSILSFAMAAFAEKLRQSYWARFYSYQDIERLLLSLPRHYHSKPQVRELKQLISIAAQLDSGHDTFEASYPISNVSFDRVPLLD